MLILLKKVCYFVVVTHKTPHFLMTNFTFIIDTILTKNFDLDKRRLRFLSHCLGLFLRILGRLNFLQLARYSRGAFVESSYRNNFEEYFDFSTFNTALVLDYGSGNYVLALDMTYISKSGQSTYGLGKYWSGCDSEAKWGLEAGILACIDVEHKTAFSIDAVQTPSKQEREALGISYFSHCIDILRWNEANLSKLSPYLVLDAYFTKKSFILPLLEKTGFQMIGRLRKDANLRYLYQGKPTGKKGRPQKYAGKVDWQNLEAHYWTIVEEDDISLLQEAILYAPFLKRNIKVVLQTDKKTKKKTLYFSTDTQLAGNKIKHYYSLRFQEEFLIRDAKQFTGLNHCQARSQNKIEFHWNMSLAAVNIAKATQYINIEKEKRKTFSMSDVKIKANNEYFLDFIFHQLSLNPKLIKNKQIRNQITNFGLKQGYS